MPLPSELKITTSASVPLTDHCTMRDLAVLAQTSVNTVSLALRDSPKVASSTKKVIRDLAARHHYRPNPLVSAFAASKRRPPATQTLAVLTKFASPDFLRSRPVETYSTALLEGMQDKATELGFRLEEFPTHMPDSPDGTRLTKILSARGIRGIIFFPSGELTVEYPALDLTQFAVVAAGFHARQVRIHRTAPDHTVAMEICLAELQARGYRRIGLAFTKDLDPRLRYECSGQYLAWRERQPNAFQVPVIQSDYYWPTSDSVREWIKQHRPDSIITHAYNVPAEVGEWNRQNKDDIAVAHLALPAEIPCAGVDLRIKDVGRTAVSILARELYLNHYGVPAFPEVCLVGGVWRDGQSIRPRPA